MTMSSMPRGAKIGGAGIGGLGVTMLMYRLLPGTMFFYVMIGTTLLGVLMGVFGWLIHRRKKRKAAPMEQGIKDNSAAAPQAVSEPGRRARLDDLRKNFDEGMEKFKAAGNNLYEVPWYVIVGESGSGKTEAVRHCNVGFPPGLQDQLQGVGGTINMNWWFTNHAVILDTAGRLMFEEVEPGASNEWREFLKLLRASRPNCPINGLLLVIPADSLIKDTTDELERKGGKIAQQFDQIQRALGVRFPVFVIISKCDLINGFREFFDDIIDPKLQHQMLGWSNPAELDEAFNPEHVREHLEIVVERLKRRRLGLLLDPVNTEDPAARRTDQVDAMFQFPEALMRVAPRLQQYLRMIFMPGPFAPKPLFLRGIYLTSSMREGEALDEQLAQVLGVPLESLPEGKVWERDRAYFLRDLFMNKAFREKGLVTNATSAKGRQRRRKALVLAAGFLSVLVVALFTYLGYASFRDSIGAETNYWRAAALPDLWYDDGSYGLPVVYREEAGSPQYDYLGNYTIASNVRQQNKDMVRDIGLDDVRVAQFHSDTAQLVQKDLHVPWVFRLAATFSEGINDNRRQAQQILYEAGVLRPLVDAARNRMESGSEKKWSPDATRALAQLIRLEADTVYPRTPAAADPNLLFHLFDYVLRNPKDANDYRIYQEKDAANLNRSLRLTYHSGEDHAEWPPAALAPAGKDALAAVDKGIGDFIAFWQAGGGIPAGEILEAIGNLTQALRRYAGVEAELLKVDDRYRDEPAQPDTLTVLNQIAAEWDKRLKVAVADSGTVAQAIAAAKLGDRGLVELYKQTVTEKLDKARPDHQVLRATASPPGAQAATQPTDPNDVKTRKLHLRTVAARLDKSMADLKAQFDKSDIRQELAEIDPNYLRMVRIDREDLRKRLDTEAMRLFALRLRIYQDANATLAGKDTMPEMAGLKPAMDRVEAGVKEADRSIGDLAALAVGSFRVKPASEVSTFVTGRLAKRKRIHALIRHVLENAPQSSDQVGQKVMQRAEKLGAISRPSIPGTNFQKGGTFPNNFHPKAAAATFAGWKAIQQQTQNPDVIDRAELARLYQARQVAYNSYLGDYLKYWSKDVLGELAYRCDGWAQFHKEIVPMQVRAVAADMERLGRTILSSLEEVEKVVPDDALPKHKEMIRLLREDLAKFREGTYMSFWPVWLRRWKDLGADPYAARAAILALKPGQFIDDYMPSANVETLVSESYWKALASAGLELLARQAVMDVDGAYTAMGKYSRFPLSVPQPGQKELTLADVDAARQALKRVFGAAGAYGKGTIGELKERVSTGNSAVDAPLKQLCGLGLADEKRTWCEKLARVLAAMPPAKETYPCVISTVGMDKHKELCRGGGSAVGIWNVVEVRQAGRIVGSKRNIPVGDEVIGKAVYPAKGLTVLLYTHPDSTEPDRSKEVAGTWGPVSLLHSVKAKQASADGKTWHVELVFKDKQGTARSLWLQLAFDKPMPKLTDWPAAAP